MIKKALTAAVIAVMFSIISTPASATEIIGEVLSTDIGALIDGQPISSYNINDSTYIIAEDLSSYGFEVVWNEAERTLNIDKNGGVPLTKLEADEINIKKSDIRIREKLYDVYSTDIKTYIGGAEVSACSIDGQMMIKLRDLSPFGNVEFDNENRLAYIDTIKYGLEKEFETAVCETLDLGDGKTYTGEVKDGKPNGVGKLTRTGITKTGDWAQGYMGSGGVPVLAEIVPWTEKPYSAVYLGHYTDGELTGLAVYDGNVKISDYWSTMDEGKNAQCTHEDWASGFNELANATLIINADKDPYSMQYLLYGSVSCDHDCLRRGGAVLFYPWDDIYNLSFNKKIMAVPFNKTSSDSIEALIRLKQNSYLSYYEHYSCRIDGNYLYGSKIVSPDIVVTEAKNVKIKEFTPDGNMLDENNNLYTTYLHDGNGGSIGAFANYGNRPMYARRNVAAQSDEITKNFGVVLAQDGNVWRVNDIYDDSKDTLILENIKAIGRKSYLTNSGELYYTDFENINEKIADNVEELRPDGIVGGSSDFYKTSDGRLFSLKNGESTFIAENVFSYDPDGGSVAYVTNGGEVYFYNVYDGITVTPIGSGAVSVSADSYMITYLTADGDMYAYFRTGYYGVPSWLGSSDTAKKVASGIKKAVSDYNGSVLALTNENTAYLYSRLWENPVEVGTDIKDINKNFKMIANNGSLWNVYTSSDDIEKHGAVEKCVPGRMIKVEN